MELDFIETIEKANEAAHAASSRLNDQFDLSDVFLAISVAVLAVTSLTRQR